MVLQQVAILITGRLQTQVEPFREGLLQPGAPAHRTGRFIQGPAPQLHKAGLLIPVHPVAQDHQSHQHIADRARPDPHPIAGPVPQDHRPTAGLVPPVPHPIADRAAVLIQEAAGPADHHPDPIQAEADHRVVHPTQVVAAVPGRQADQVQADQEDNNIMPRVKPGHYSQFSAFSSRRFSCRLFNMQKS